MRNNHNKLFLKPKNSTLQRLNSFPNLSPQPNKSSRSDARRQNTLKKPKIIRSSSFYYTNEWGMRIYSPSSSCEDENPINSPLLQGKKFQHITSSNLKPLPKPQISISPPPLENKKIEKKFQNFTPFKKNSPSTPSIELQKDLTFVTKLKQQVEASLTPSKLTIPNINISDEPPLSPSIIEPIINSPDANKYNQSSPDIKQILNYYPPYKTFGSPNNNKKQKSLSPHLSALSNSISPPPSPLSLSPLSFRKNLSNDIVFKQLVQKIDNEITSNSTMLEEEKEKSPSWKHLKDFPDILFPSISPESTSPPHLNLFIQ